MRAVLIREFGGPEKLQLVDLPDPRPAAGEVLVAVAAAGVDRVDVLVRSGAYHRVSQPPMILGVEGSGTVVAVGEGVTHLVAGQQVVAMGASNAPGFYAELALVPATQAVAVPHGSILPRPPRCQRPGCRRGTACAVSPTYGPARMSWCTRRRAASAVQRSRSA